MSDLKRYLTSRQLAMRYEKCTRTITRWTEARPSGFPLPVRINGRLLWLESEINDWERVLAASAANEKQGDAAHDVAAMLGCEVRR